MHCKHCGFANGEDDHRCLRCGRRLTGIVIAAPPGYSGANALAVAPAFDANETQDIVPPVTAQGPETTRQRATQPGLFAGSDQKVIPFDQIQRHVTARSAPVQAPPTFGASPLNPPAPPRTTVTRPSARKAASPGMEQGSLDFPAAPARKGNEVAAQIVCGQTVATPQHRSFAAAVDASMILLAFGAFCLIVEVTGAGFGTGKLFSLMLGGCFVLISLFYGLIWALASRETFGMQYSDLKLITFDGVPLDSRSRAVRFAATWLSFCSGGLGIVWAVADEENLTWHDHISKTFPTFRDAPSHPQAPPFRPGR